MINQERKGRTGFIAIQEAVNPLFYTDDWGRRKEELGAGLAEKVGKGLAKGRRRVGERLAKGFLAPSNLANSRNARLEERVSDSMGNCLGMRCLQKCVFDIFV